MSVVYEYDAERTPIAPGRERYLCHTPHLMVVVVDFNDGPTAQPDPPHSHPHEQVTYVAEGEVLFFIDQVSYKLKVGDMIAVPANVPHTVQLLTQKVRLVDTFNPIRADFLK